MISLAQFDKIKDEIKNINQDNKLDVLDLGNNHYLFKPNVKYDQSLHFSEVFSPGATFLLGIRNTPFVFSLGTRFLPLQSDFTEDNIEINSKTFDAIILHGRIKIDIPLINLRFKE